MLDRLISSTNFIPRDTSAASRALFNTPEMRTRRAAFMRSPYGGRFTAPRSNARRARSRTATRTQRRRPTTYPGILGGQNADTRLVYRRKRMPRRKRRAWVKFVKKVNAVDEKELGARTVLFNQKINQIATADLKQSTLTLCLYPFTDATNGWLNDMQRIGQFENENDPTAIAGATIDRNTKVMFQSAVMDITLRNTSQIVTSIGPTVYGPAPEASIELDLYEMYMRQEASDGANPINNAMSGILDAWDDKEIGGAGNGISIGDRGASPFEMGTPLGRFGVKVIKKTKYFIPNGQTITYQARDPKRHVIHYGDLERQEGWNRAGWTRIYFLIYKLVPGLTPGSTAIGQYRCSIDLGTSRKYMYKVEGFNEPRERLLNDSFGIGSNV